VKIAALGFERGRRPTSAHTARQARGWTSLISTLLFSSAAQLFCMGILSEYVGRLFEETKRRPIYLVQERINFDTSNDS
jgi:hypothetical protein